MELGENFSTFSEMAGEGMHSLGLGYRFLWLVREASCVQLNIWVVEEILG